MLKLRNLIDTLRKNREGQEAPEGPQDLMLRPLEGVPQKPLTVQDTEGTLQFEDGWGPGSTNQAISDLERQQREVASSPAKKQNPWAQALFLGLQGLEKVFAPNDKPIQFLGDAKKAYKLGQIGESLRPLIEQQGRERSIMREDAIMDDRRVDNERLQEELARKKKKDADTTAYWNRKADQGDLKIAGDQELRELRDKWAESKDANDRRRLDLAEQEMRNRNIRNTENNQTRKEIAGMQQEGQTARNNASIAARRGIAQIQADVRRELAALNAAEKTKNQQAAIEARERLARLKAELGQ